MSAAAASATVTLMMAAILSAPCHAQEPPPASVGHRPSPDRDAPSQLPVALPSSASAVTGRAAENAVRQADDAFGYSVGREALGLYSSSNVRGFSPFKAGNVRIEGLYFDPYLTLIQRLRQSTSIRVGLSAQGYPFPSPTGIVDYSFRKPGASATVSVLASADSYGNAGIEADGAMPLSSTLGIGFGAQGARNGFYNGTSSWSHNEAVSLRWRPSPDIEILPFWARSQVYDDEAGPVYVPAGPYLPPRIERRRYDGPGWNDYDSVGGLQGLLATASPWRDWTMRIGLFRSLYDDRSTFAHLLTELTPEGRANRLIIADPRSRFVSVSGELRVSRSLAEGPRLHVIHLSWRGRDRRQRYGGSDFLDYGPTRIGAAFHPPEPDFAFTAQTRDRVRQGTYGVAYDGRWRDVGELSVGLSRTDYRKRFSLPDAPPLETRSRPWLWNATGAGFLGPRLAIYAGYARGLEESGIAPDNAVNRNQPLPAILTRQVDAGLRYRLTGTIKLVAGVFDLRKPYYNLDAANRFDLLGDIVNRGVEFSVAGAVTPRLNVVAGGVLLNPRVTGAGVALGRTGRRPVGIAARSLDFNADWRLPVEGLSLDAGISNTGRVIATRDNRVSIPPRTLLDLGARYRFRADRRDVTLRAEIRNVGNVRGFDLESAGAYDIIPGRIISAYVTADL